MHVTLMSRLIAFVIVECQIMLTILLFFFFNDPAPPEISPLPLPDAFPIFLSLRVDPPGRAWDAGAAQATVFRGRAGARARGRAARGAGAARGRARPPAGARARVARSEEHTSELQSPCNLVCRLLLEKNNLR